MTYVLLGFFILACVVLIIAVLLQPGKADAGALFSGSVNSTAFGARGTATLLAKITVGAAASFFLIALLMSQPALTGQRSTLDTTPDTGGAVPVPTVAPPAPGAPVPGAPVQVDPNAPATITPGAPTSPATIVSPKAETSPATAPASAPAASPAKAPGVPPSRKPNGK
jgi:protein translocase SecG subunit